MNYIRIIGNPKLHLKVSKLLYGIEGLKVSKEDIALPAY